MFRGTSVVGEELTHPLDKPRRPQEPRPLEVPVPPVAMRDEIQADRGGRCTLQRLADLDQVAERLAHLAAVVTDHPGVDPGPRKRRLVRQGFGLRTLGLVMAEHQVAAATVDVDLGSEVVLRHHRALDVPARPPFAELRRPRGLIWRRGPPEWEVEQVTLRFGPDRAQQRFVSKLAEHRAACAVGKSTVAAVLANVEVECVRAVGVSGGLEARCRGGDALDLV